MSKARDLANAGTALTTVSATELGYLDGVTSAVQTQIDSKIGSASAINPTIVDAKGDIIAASAADTVARLAVGSNDTVLTADSSTATGLKWAAVSGGYSNYQLFTSSTTWTVPTGITKCAVYIVGGGGGGGGGAAFVDNRNVGGGSGGSGGSVGIDPFFTVTPGASITVTIGGGGAGGAAVTATSSNNSGNDGVNGTTSSFGSLSAQGGQRGQRIGATFPTTYDLDTSAVYSSAIVSIRAGGTGGYSTGFGGPLAGRNGTISILSQAGSLGSSGSNATVGTFLSNGATSTNAGFAGGGGSGGGHENNVGTAQPGAGINGGGSGGGGAKSITDITTTGATGGAGATNRGGGGGGGGGGGKQGSGGAVATGAAGGNGGSGFVAVFY
jgi:hypothetical protein